MSAFEARTATVGGGQGEALLEIDDVTQVFQKPNTDTSFVALKGVSFAARRGQFISIVGPSGCGKSTLLTAVSGLVQPAVGEVRIAGERVSSVRRDVGFIFQRDALLPWRSALQNVELPLRFRGVPLDECRRRSREWLTLVGLKDFEQHFPHQLSGGMRKRVSIAATLVYEPRVLLMDEPFSALDVQTRNLLENEVIALWQNSGHQTVLFVTHDLEEAIGLSDRIIVLSASPGRVIGDYAVTLPRPRNLLTLKFEKDFTELYQGIWNDLQDEVLRAYEAQRG